jgi:hypothetical protein
MHVRACMTALFTARRFLGVKAAAAYQFAVGAST